MKYSNPIFAAAIGGALATPSAHEKAHIHHAKRDVTGSYIPGTAPRDNIFAGVTEKENESIADFLNDQVNVTLPANTYFYGNAWLLPPNKTEATAYLDGDGPKPDRYVRTIGYGDCYVTEYMVGPLPVSDATKVLPADYVNGGNSTRKSQYCEDDDNPSNSTSRSSSKLKKRSELKRRYPSNPYEEELGWDGEDLPHDDKTAPVAILPDGARFEFDPEQNYVSWMDFSFLVGSGPAGISLHDVRFKGDRIVYELTMQEALAHYAGPDESQTYASYLDVSIGFEGYNLIPGYDCPAYATYTDKFCLFEFPKDYPINRHFNYDYYHGTKNTAFMLRSLSTVGNYDYQTTYEFYHDGSIQVIVRASGYIQGSTEVNGTDAWDYGFRIRDHLSGSMHDHVLNFKLDLDVLGTKNSLFKTEFVPHSQVYPWSEGKVINTMKVDKSFITNEDQGKIHWAPNAAATYSVVNKDKKNEFGEYPGFRVYPSTGASIHLTIENSSVFENTVNWATHPFYALQRKDSEPVSAHPRNGEDYKDPFVDFNRFFDGESLDQEDLVLYFNLGMHHMPDTSDLPNTVFTSAQSGITIRPQNYLRSDNSMSTRQQIDITSKNGKPNIDTYGAKMPSGSFDLDQINNVVYPVVDSWDDFPTPTPVDPDSPGMTERPGPN